MAASPTDAPADSASSQPPKVASDRGRPKDSPISFWVVTSLAIFLLLFLGIGKASGWDWFPWRGPKDQVKLSEAIQFAVAGTGIFGAAVATAITIRRQRSTEESVRISAESQQIAARAQETAAQAQQVSAEAYRLEVERWDGEAVRVLRDRFAKAGDQLDSNNPASRVSAVHSLANLADEWIRRKSLWDAQTCLSVMCLAVRPTAERRADDRSLEASAVLRQMSRHMSGDPGLDWSGFEFDLSNITFVEDVDLRGVKLRENTLVLRGSTFLKDLIIDEMHMLRSTLILEGAQVKGCFTMTGSTVRGSEIVIKGAHMRGDISFRGATFDNSTVDFSGARLENGGERREASSGATLSALELSDTRWRAKAVLNLEQATISHKRFNAPHARFLEKSRLNAWESRWENVKSYFGIEGLYLPWPELNIHNAYFDGSQLNLSQLSGAEDGVPPDELTAIRGSEIRLPQSLKERVNVEELYESWTVHDSEISMGDVVINEPAGSSDGVH